MSAFYSGLKVWYNDCKISGDKYIMNKDEQAIFKAMKHLKTVRRPVPEKLNKDELLKDIEKVHPFFKQVSDEMKIRKESDLVESVTIMVLMIQRKFFNRSLWQITANSLVDLITEVATKMVGNNKGELIQITGVVIHLSEYLAEHRLVMDNRDLTDRLLDTLKQRRPDLIDQLYEQIMLEEGTEAGFDMSTEGTLTLREMLANDPIRLSGDEQISYLFFADPRVDFNEFIGQIYNKHNRAQLLLAYSFFNERKMIGSEILDYASTWTPQNVNDPYDTFRLNFSIAKDLDVNGVINLSKVFHQFMRFCQDQGLVTALQYREVLKNGNNDILDTITDQGGIFRVITKKQAEVRSRASEIFSKPNYTINAKKATEILSDLNWQNKDTVFKSMHFSTSNSAKLSKKLDQHQLDLELKKANKEIENLKDSFPSIKDISELKMYEDFVIKVHTKMVKKYNRRLRNWTMESLIDCLETLYRSNHKMYEYPAHLRYLELYIGQLDDDNAIGSFSSLINGLEIITERYLALGTNWYGNGGK